MFNSVIGVFSFSRSWICRIIVVLHNTYVSGVTAIRKAELVCSSAAAGDVFLYIFEHSLAHSCFNSKNQGFTDNIQGSLSGLFSFRMNPFFDAEQTSVLKNFFKKLRKKSSIWKKSLDVYKCNCFIYRCKYSTFFFTFWVPVFSTILVPPRSLVTISLETASSGTYWSVMPILREYQIVQIVLKFFDVATLLSPQ